MAYVMFRIILFIIVLIVLTLFIRKSNVVRKRTLMIMSFILCSILSSLSHLVPIENYFVTFKDHEEVFKYTTLGEAVDIVYGEHSCLVVYSTGENSYSYTIILK